MFQTYKFQTGTAAHTLEKNPSKLRGPDSWAPELRVLGKDPTRTHRPLLFYTPIQNTHSFKMTNLNTKMTLYHCMALNVFSALYTQPYVNGGRDAHP